VKVNTLHRQLSYAARVAQTQSVRCRVQMMRRSPRLCLRTIQPNQTPQLHQTPSQAMSERSLLQLRCMLQRRSTPLIVKWPVTSERLLCRAEGDDEAQGAREMDFSSIADPFGDQESGGGSNRKQADRQHSGDERGSLQHPQHWNDRQSGHHDQAEEDDDDGQTMLFLKVTAGDRCQRMRPTTLGRCCMQSALLQVCLARPTCLTNVVFNPLRSACRSSSTSPP
jgi:hypothetical protein